MRRQTRKIREPNSFDFNPQPRRNGVPKGVKRDTSLRDPEVLRHCVAYQEKGVWQRNCT